MEKGSRMEQGSNKQGKKRIPFWITGFGLGVVLLVVGAFNGQLADIYRKAVMICLECIGIG